MKISLLGTVVIGSLGIVLMSIHYILLPISGRYYVNIGYIKTRPNVEFSLYLKKAGLASRNIVHLQKIILRCVGVGFCILHFICKTDQITIGPTYTSRIIVPVAYLNILYKQLIFHSIAAKKDIESHKIDELYVFSDDSSRD